MTNAASLLQELSDWLGNELEAKAGHEAAETASGFLRDETANRALESDDPTEALAAMDALIAELEQSRDANSFDLGYITALRAMANKVSLLRTELGL